MHHAKTQARQQPGQPTAGQFAQELKAAPTGVTLEDIADEPSAATAPADLSHDDVMRALWNKRDPLGLGTDYQTEARGVKVYYASDDAKAIGVNTTPTGMVQLFEYDPDDGDFDYPYLLARTSPETARATVAGHLGIDEHANRAIARMKTLTEDEKRLLRAVHDDSNEGARQDVRTEAFNAISEASWQGQIPAPTNIMHGQQQRAMAEAGVTTPEAQIAADAVWALQRRHLVGDPRVSDGHRGWSQRAYDQLTRPVREVLGPIHPDDAPMERLEPGFEDEVIAEAYASDHPYTRNLAADTARAVLADRLDELGVTSYSLYHRDGEVRVDGVEIDGNPDPDENYALYDEARELVEQYATNYMPINAFKADLITLGGRSGHGANTDGAALTYEVADYAGEGLASAIELRDDVLAERRAAQRSAA